MSMPTVETTVAAIVHLLSSHGPMTDDGIIEALRDQGVDLGTEPGHRLSEVLDEGDDVVVRLHDGRLVWLPGLLDGRILTHRVSEVEANHDMLAIGPDLTAVAMLTENSTYRGLLDGSPIVDVSPWDVEVLEERGLGASDLEHDEAWLLPPGHLAGLGVEAGDLVGVQVTAAGFDIIAVDTVRKSTAVAAIAARLGEQPDHPELIAVAVWALCDTHINALREPIAPLGELLPAIGLVLEGEWVAPAGFEFALWRASSRMASMMTRHDLDIDEGAAVLTAIMLYETIRDRVETVLADTNDADWGLDGSPAPHVLQRAQEVTEGADFEADTRFMDARDALDFLEEPIVAEAFLAEASSTVGFSAVTLVVFTRHFEKVAPRAARPAMLWLRGRAHEHVGEIDLAEQAFRAAEAQDPSWPLTLLSLARIASDRGDAERGLSLLQRAGALPEAPLVRMLEAFQPVARPTTSRNDPCWCGSGRKYKQCHLHREHLPLLERAAWLYQKATTDLLAGPSASLLLDVAAWRFEDDGPDALESALSDDLSVDVVLFEGGAFVDFLDRRGALLPADEAVLAQQWLQVTRSVHEVVGLVPGESITLRDARTGEERVVRAPEASARVQLAELYCARVVPVGDTMQIFGGMEPVSPEDRGTLLAILDGNSDPLELVVFLSRQARQD